MFMRMTLLVTALALAACASRSVYAPADTTDSYGYYSTSLGTNRYRVTFNGNPSTGPNTVTDFALLRAAELTVEQRMDWFQVVERATNTVEKSSGDAGIGQQRGAVIDRDCGLLGCRSTVRPAPRTPFGADTATPRTTYSVSLEIVMGNNPVPAQDGRYYDAEALMQQLWQAM
jgi:hypothetical protein